MTIAEKLASIKASKEAIKQAIQAKGVSCGDVLSEYPEKIAAIPTGGDGIDMSKGISFSNSSFTSEQFESLKTYNWDKVKKMSYMFEKCTSLTTIPLLDTSNVTNMGYVFTNCSKLTTIPQLDTSNVITTISMLAGCGKLLEIPLLNTSNVTNMNSMFTNCSNLTTIPQFVTSNVTNMNSMFTYCSKLTTIPLLDTSKVTNMGYMFNGCTNLTNLGGFQNLSVKLDLHFSTLLTVESLMNVINNLKDLTGGTAQTLTLGSTNLAKLTDEQKAVATNKNWVLA